MTVNKMSTSEVSNKMSRRTFISASVLAVPAAASALAAPAGASAIAAPATASALAVPALLKGERKRNVLFISTDDMCNRLGCYDVPVVKSPNLDRLAQSGVRFDHHYCQFPLCGPSRTSLMTGLAPDTTKVWDLNTDFRDTIPQTVTMPQLFQKNGYFTARAGKIYHYNNPSEIGTPGFDDAPSWQKTANPVGYDRTHDEALVTHYVPQKRMIEALFMGHGRSGAQGSPMPVPQHSGSKVPWLHGGMGPSGIRIAQDGSTPILPLSHNGDLGIDLAGHPSDGGDQNMTDYMVAESVIAMMEEHKNEPWFLGAGFYRPHVPFIVPSKYYDMYSVDEMQIPPFDPAELMTGPRIAYNSMDPNFGMTPQQHRECLRGYYAAISFVDAQVGRLLDALQRLDLAKDTTIVFWADHGFMVGEHGQWEKTMLFEPSARVPFIIAGAGVAAPGRGCKRTSEHLNIYPTLAEMCKLQGTPTNLQGRSLVPLLQNPDAPWDHPAVSQVSRGYGPNPTMGYSVRTERYRYTMWKGGVEGEELYDYQEDPRELKNLADDAIASDLKAKLRASLEKIARPRGMKDVAVP
jgi:iduronate 2-sulfatase